MWRRIDRIDPVADVQAIKDRIRLEEITRSEQRLGAPDGCPYGYTKCMDSDDLLFQNQCVALPRMCNVPKQRPRTPSKHRPPPCGNNEFYCPEITEPHANLYGGYCVTDRDMCYEPRDMESREYWGTNVDSVGRELQARQRRHPRFRPHGDRYVWDHQSIYVPEASSKTAERMWTLPDQTTEPAPVMYTRHFNTTFVPYATDHMVTHNKRKSVIRQQVDWIGITAQPVSKIYPDLF